MIFINMLWLSIFNIKDEFMGTYSHVWLLIFPFNDNNNFQCFWNIILWVMPSVDGKMVHSLLVIIDLAFRALADCPIFEKVLITNVFIVSFVLLSNYLYCVSSLRTKCRFYKVCGGRVKIAGHILSLQSDVKHPLRCRWVLVQWHIYSLLFSLKGRCDLRKSGILYPRWTPWAWRW